MIGYHIYMKMTYIVLLLK